MMFFTVVIFIVKCQSYDVFVTKGRRGWSRDYYFTMVFNFFPGITTEYGITYVEELISSFWIVQKY
jgi:hypothetical protein